jgi:outer membrane protein
MRNLNLKLVLLAGLLGAIPANATASFANRSLGLGLTGFKLFGESGNIDWGVPISLEAAYYIENGFELYLRVPAMVLSQPLLVPPVIFGTGGQFGLRYLFMEESIRPFINFHLAGLVFFREPKVVFAGPGAGAGIEFFVGDSVSLGLRAYGDLFVTLADRGFIFSVAVGGGIFTSVYF